MQEFPQIKTKRLLLSRILHTDIPQIVEYANNIKVAEMTMNIPHPYAAKDAIFWICKANEGFENKTQYTFAVRLKETEAFMGGMGLIINKRYDRAELGYWIAEPFWNKGFATEAAGALIRFGFEKLDLNKILATHLVENPASGRVMIKNGMIKEGELKDHYKKWGQYRSVVQYRLTKAEFQQLNT